MKKILLFFVLAVATLRLSAVDIYVSPSGSDGNDGTASSPFATIAKARDTIRMLKGKAGGLPSGGVTVWLGAGYYNLSGTIVFDRQDSGTAGQPIVYAAKSGEPAYVTGARSLDPSWFTRVTSSSPVWSRLDATARGKVYAVSLREHGIADFGTLKERGKELRAIAPMELFSNGNPMTLARWPNRHDALALADSSPSTHQVTYLGTRPERWTHAQEVWAHGLWSYDWADYHLKVSTIDPATKTITFEKAPPKYGLGKRRPFYVYNLLEEIDEPGEYYIDRASGILYFWPPSALATSNLQVSLLETYLLQLTGAHFLTFRNIVFEASRAGLLRVDSADHDRFEECALRNAGQYGIQINGSNSGLDRCVVAGCGDEGVILTGGNRATLTPGHDFVTNTWIHDTSRLDWCYRPAINLSGCGLDVSHNLIENLPHSAIIFTGNNHLIEYNEISNVCHLTSDAGAIYTGRDWGYRGNIIRYNFIHHIESDQKANGVYLDDCMSSAEVFGNVFYRITGAAIFCGGGRDNIMTNNLIALCYTGHYNGDYARSHIDNIPDSSFNLLQRLAADGIRYQAEPWASAYPALAAIPNSWTEIQKGLWRNPQNCVFANNAGWDNTKWTVEGNHSGTGVFSVYASMANNLPTQTPLFDEKASLDRSLRPAKLTASIKGFAPIPFSSIGPAR